MILKRLISFSFLILVILTAPVWAHVPYLEETDYTENQPFAVPKSIEQSIACYSWLETDFINPSTDVDCYSFTLTEPVNVFIEVIGPVCSVYEEFVPWFALIGPGLPDPTYDDLPFQIGPGEGAIVMENVEPGEERETFYEPFGGKSYYQGPTFSQVIDVPGDYKVCYWDPHQHGGDYVAVLGDKEIWELDDIIRALIETPKIRRDEELHTECKEPDDDDDDDDDIFDDDDDDDVQDDDDSDDDISEDDDDSSDDDDDDDSAEPDQGDSEDNSEGCCG